MKPRKPTGEKPKKPPRTRVNRKELLKLIRRYRRYLGAQVKYLKDLDGETVGINDAFSNGEAGPPAHPSCRCTVMAGNWSTP